MRLSAPLLSHVSGHLRLPHIPPRNGLTVSTFLALILLIATVHVAVHQPSLGINWGPAKDNKGLVVESIVKQKAGPPPGTRIVSVKAPDGSSMMLSDDLLLEDPDQFSTYTEYNAFFNKQLILSEIYAQKKVVLISDSGQQWSVSAGKIRPLNRLPISFWMLNLSAAVCFLVGCGVWSYKRGDISARLLATTGICYYCSILCLSVYGSRELVMDPGLFHLLSAANHLCTVTWCYSLLLLLMFYPSKIAGRATIAAVYLLSTLVWVNQTIQFIQIPVHAYYSLNHIVPYGFGLLVGCIQWHQTAQRPVERAALQWFVLSIWISIGVSGSFFIVPSLTAHIGEMPLWVPALSIQFMFICFALGIFRYGLFNLERWWFTGWTWLAAGGLISAIDMLLVFTLDISIELIIPYSILLLGWIYFPIRHWLWQRVMPPQIYQLEYHLPVVIQSLFKSRSMQSFIDRWADMLKQVFQPLDIIVVQEPRGDVVAAQYGLELQVPNLDGNNFCRLIGNRQGSRLFGSKDVYLAKSLLSLSQAIYAITKRTREVQKEGAERERERIMRDLHDDVLPKLISIKQQAPEGAITKMAEAAFQSIRETIYLLRDPSIEPLEEIIADWRAETAERLYASGLSLQWNGPDQPGKICLTPRQCIACGRILREAISNIIQHACADLVRVLFRIEEKRLHLEIIDNGCGIQIENPKGLGTNNMRMRARGLNGAINWFPNPKPNRGVTVRLSFPLDDIEGSQISSAIAMGAIHKESA